MSKSAKAPQDKDLEDTILQAVINAIPAPIFFKNADGLYLGCNDAFAEFVGRKKEEVIGKGVFELWDEGLAKVYHDADTALINIGGKQLYEAKVTYANGTIHDVMFHKSVFYTQHDNSKGIVGVMLDITERKKAEAELETIARTDTLTGLANRHTFFDYFDAACKRAKRNKTVLAVLALDLDGFKRVNDEHGHPAGDELLVTVARRMKESVRETDLVSRIGGDEFVIVLEDAGSKDYIATAATHIIKNIAKPCNLKNCTVDVSVSVGIALYGQDGTQVDELIRNSDQALYAMKAHGKEGYAFHNDEPVHIK